MPIPGSHPAGGPVDSLSARIRGRVSTRLVGVPVEVSLLTLCPLGQPNKAIGHESQIEPWLTHIAQPFCLMAFQKSTESTQYLSRFGEKHRAAGKE